MSLSNQVSYGQFPITLNTASGAGSYTPMYLSQGFRNAIWTLVVSGSFSGTIKFYASNQDTRPDLSVAASASNIYSTCQTINLKDGNPINGDTGFVLTGAGDGIYTIEINENTNRWIGAIMTARSAGSVSIFPTFSDNL